MIDWDAPDPKPDFTPPQNVVEIRTLADAMALLERWEAAHDAAVTAWARLHSEYVKMKFRAECAETLASNFEALYAAALDPANDDIRDKLSLILRRA